MKQKYPEIKFDNQNDFGSHFDIVSLQTVLSKKPSDHSQFKFHKISFYTLLFFIKGNGKYNLNFKDYSFSEGTAFTINKDNIHKFYKSQAEGILFIFTKKFILKHSNKLEASKIFLLFNEMLSSPKIQLSKQDFSVISNLIGQAQIEYSDISDRYSTDIVSNLVQIILGKLLRVKSSNNQLLENNKQLSDFIEFQNYVEKYCFSNRQVSFYAKKMSISTKKLNSVTRAIVNTPAKSFINMIFIILAKRLIVSSNDTLTKIAYQTGFDEPTNFFKFFKKHCKISAKEFRINNSS